MTMMMMMNSGYVSSSSAVEEAEWSVVYLLGADLHWIQVDYLIVIPACGCSCVVCLCLFVYYPLHYHYLYHYLKKTVRCVE